MIVLLSSAASAANGMTPVRTVCKYFTLSDARQIFGSTVSRTPGTAAGSCQYSASPKTLSGASATSPPLPGVLVQMSRGPKPQALTAKPTAGAQRVRVGSVFGWYVPATGANDIGTLLVYDQGRLVQVAAYGTHDDGATSEHIGSVVLRRL
jgi:hypothetical protein